MMPTCGVTAFRKEAPLLQFECDKTFFFLISECDRLSKSEQLGVTNLKQKENAGNYHHNQSGATCMLVDLPRSPKEQKCINP